MAPPSPKKGGSGDKKEGSSPPQVKIQLVNPPAEGQPAGIGTVVFYSLASLVLLSYCGYLYDRQAFESASKSVPVLQPLTVFFDVIEAYSPFHEFIDDDMLRKNAQKDATKANGAGKKTTKKGQEIRVVMSADELKAYDGVSDPSKGPYLAFLGHVFDVSKGKEHYGAGGGYAFFAGRDASRAFVTGEFDEAGLTDDVIGLETENYLGLQDWLTFYRSDYRHVGYLEGRYFDSEGTPTDYGRRVGALMEAAEAAKHARLEEHDVFPPCNSAWSAASGHRIWCTVKSGGVDRTWVGVPRRLFAPGAKQERCACVKATGAPVSDDSVSAANGNNGGRGDLDHPHLKEYPGCDPMSHSCQLSPPPPNKETSEEDEDEDELNAEDLRLMHGEL